MGQGNKVASLGPRLDPAMTSAIYMCGELDLISSRQLYKSFL